MTPKEKNSPRIFIRGLFINPTLAEIEEKGQKKHKQKIMEEIGRFYLDPLESYPIIYMNIAEQTLCDILYGKYTPDAYFEFGKKSCDRFMNSPFGTTVTSFVGKNPEYIFLNVHRLYNIVAEGVKITCNKLEEKKVSVRFHNDPYPLRGIEGLVTRGIEHMDVKNGKVKFINHGNNDHEFIVTWEDK